MLGVARAAAPLALSGGCSAQTPSASPADSRARARPPGGSQRFAWPSAPGPQLVPRESRENRKLEWGSRTGNAGTLATVRSRKGDSTRPRCPRGRERERAGESGWAVPCRGGVIGRQPITGASTGRGSVVAWATRSQHLCRVGWRAGGTDLGAPGSRTSRGSQCVLSGRLALGDPAVESPLGLSG